jgi:CubicO group peptidase (beta-lactamase class C family)
MLFVLTTIVVLGPADVPQKSLRQNVDPGLVSQIDAYIQPFVAGNNFPGAILVARGDEVVFSKAYGMANYELKVANTPNSRFHLASVSKMFTAAAVLLLEEQGKLSTSDKVSRFVPSYPAGDKISLEQLLTHTAGVPKMDFGVAERRVHHKT